MAVDKEWDRYHWHQVVTPLQNLVVILVAVASRLLATIIVIITITTITTSLFTSLLTIMMPFMTLKEPENQYNQCMLASLGSKTR